MEYLTPVPWELTGPAEPGWQEDPDFEFFEVHGSDGDLVALVAGEANARLIVAQSDLLAAAADAFIAHFDTRKSGPLAMALRPG